jgi:hypothetical protein
MTGSYAARHLIIEERDMDADHAAQLADLQAPEWEPSAGAQVWTLIGAARILFAGQLHTGDYRVEDQAGRTVITVRSFADLPTA